MALSIFAAAELSPRAEALRDRGCSIDYAELAHGAHRALGWLAERGVSAGSTRPVAVVAASERATLEMLHALFALGAPALLVHARSTPAERDALLDRIRPELRVDPSWRSQSLPRLPPIPAPPPDDDRPLAILPTSGSTGTPELIPLSRRAFALAAGASAERLGWRSDDRWLACLPLAHVGGLAIVVRCLLARTSVVLAHASDPDTLTAHTERDRVTLASLVPTQLARWLEHPSFRPPPALRAALIGGAGASPELLARARAAGIPALATYGMTETCGQVATQALDDPGTEGVGRPLPGFDVRVADGRVRVRPPWHTGWIETNDLGRFDGAGRLIVLGRAGDRIVTGGENVDPLEVERVLCRFAGVTAACVFGVDDAVWGQRVAAVVSARAQLDTAELARFTRAELAAHKRPRLLAIADSLHTLPSGKLDRARIAAEHRARLATLDGA